MPENRNLTDDDIEAIVNELEKRFADNVFKSLGQGFWGLIKKGLLITFGGVALYGMTKGIRP